MALTWEDGPEETRSETSASTFKRVRELMKKAEAQAQAQAEVEAFPGDVPGSDFDQPSLGAYCIPTPDSTCWPSKDAWKSELHDMLSMNATSILPYHVGFSNANVMR